MEHALLQIHASVHLDILVTIAPCRCVLKVVNMVEIVLHPTHAPVRRVGQGMTAPLRYAHKSATTEEGAWHQMCANASSGEVCGVISVKQEVNLCTVTSMVIPNTLGGQDLIVARRFVLTHRTLH